MKNTSVKNRAADKPSAPENMTLEKLAAIIHGETAVHSINDLVEDGGLKDLRERVTSDDLQQLAFALRDTRKFGPRLGDHTTIGQLYREARTRIGAVAAAHFGITAEDALQRILTAPAKNDIQQTGTAPAGNAPADTAPGSAHNPLGSTVKLSADAKALTQPGSTVVYTGHGIGRVMGLQTQVVAGVSISVLVLVDEHSKTTLRVPLQHVNERIKPMPTTDELALALQKMGGNARRRSGPWSRANAEYQAKVRSHDPLAIAEVIRDIAPRVNNDEMVYSYRILLEQAESTFARFYAYAHKVTMDDAYSAILTATKRTRVKAAAPSIGTSPHDTPAKAPRRPTQPLAERTPLGAGQFRGRRND